MSRQTTGDAFTVTCLPDAKITRTTVAALANFASRCTPDSILCGSASWAYCQSLGYVGGFGPIEVNGADLDLACLAR